MLIKSQTDQYRPKKKAGVTISTLSQKLNLSLGMTDKKGKDLNLPEHIQKLELRRQRLIKKMAGK